MPAATLQPQYFPPKPLWTHWRYFLAVAAGALVGILGYLAVPTVYPYHSRGFYEDQYAKGYNLGEALTTDVRRGWERCGDIADTLYDQTSPRAWEVSGGAVFVQGCADAVEGKPADPDNPKIATVYPRFFGDGD